MRTAVRGAKQDSDCGFCVPCLSTKAVLVHMNTLLTHTTHTHATHSHTHRTHTHTHAHTYTHTCTCECAHVHTHSHTTQHIPLTYMHTPLTYTTHTRHSVTHILTHMCTHSHPYMCAHTPTHTQSHCHTRSFSQTDPFRNPKLTKAVPSLCLQTNTLRRLEGAPPPAARCARRSAWRALKAGPGVEQRERAPRGHAPT